MDELGTQTGLGVWLPASCPGRVGSPALDVARTIFKLGSLEVSRGMEQVKVSREEVCPGLTCAWSLDSDAALS